MPWHVIYHLFERCKYIVWVCIKKPVVTYDSCTFSVTRYARLASFLKIILTCNFYMFVKQFANRLGSQLLCYHL
jgi:hypothetical protein